MAHGLRQEGGEMLTLQPKQHNFNHKTATILSDFGRSDAVRCALNTGLRKLNMPNGFEQTNKAFLVLLLHIYRVHSVVPLNEPVLVCFCFLLIVSLELPNWGWVMEETKWLEGSLGILAVAIFEMKN